MKKLIILASIFLLSACTHASQTVYDGQDVGKENVLEYGIIIAMRPIQIQPESTSGGALAGTLAGGVAGSDVGQGTGNAVATVGGALIGMAVGAMAEQKLSRRDGIEYTIAEHGGKVISIAQNVSKDDVPLKVGQHVVVQSNEKDHYRRVLPADNLPDAVERPKALKIED